MARRRKKSICIFVHINIAGLRKNRLCQIMKYKNLARNCGADLRLQEDDFWRKVHVTANSLVKVLPDGKVAYVSATELIAGTLAEKRKRTTKKI